MKQFSKQFYKKASTVKLQVDEKRELRERVVSYMEYHPLPADLRSQKSKKASINTSLDSQIFINSFKTVSIPFISIFKSSGVAVLMLLVVIPFMAEKTVPGDTLYSVKVQFNEELRSTLTFDRYHKVEWETERLNRRIAEARLLASEGLLTESLEIEVAEAVRSHTNSVKKEIEELRAEDVDEATIASITLDTTLEVQAASLESDENNNNSGVARSVQLIASVINEALAENKVEEEQSELPSYDKMMARIEQNTTRVYELRNMLVESVSDTDTEDVGRRIEDVSRSVSEAILVREDGSDESRLMLVDVLQRTQKLIVYMTELEIKETVDIEILMPVVLTEVEQDLEIILLAEELSKLSERISNLLLLVTDEEVVEKVVFAQGLISTTSINIASSTKDFVSQRVLINEALEIASDTVSFLEKYVDSEVLPEIDLDEELEIATTSEEVIDDKKEVSIDSMSPEEGLVILEKSDSDISEKESVKVEIEIEDLIETQVSSTVDTIDNI